MPTSEFQYQRITVSSFGTLLMSCKLQVNAPLGLFSKAVVSLANGDHSLDSPPISSVQHFPTFQLDEMWRFSMNNL